MRENVRDEAKKIHLGLIKFLFVGGYVKKMPENRCVTLKQYSKYLEGITNSQQQAFEIIQGKINDNHLRTGLISTFQTNAKNTLLSMISFFESPDFVTACESTKCKLSDLVLFFRFLLAELIISDFQYNEIINLLANPSDV